MSWTRFVSAHDFGATSVEVLDQHANAVVVHRVDRPTRARRADALAERAVARADHRQSGDQRFGHDDPERLCVRAREQDDLDARAVEELGQVFVGVRAVNPKFRRNGFANFTELVDLDAGIPERLRELVRHREALLRPSESDERDAQRLVVDQIGVRRSLASVQPDDRTVFDDRDSRPDRARTRAGSSRPRSGVGKTQWSTVSMCSCTVARKRSR